MIIDEAIKAARALRDTEISNAEMIQWLSSHDEQLYERCLRHYGVPRPTELPYTQFIGSDNGQDDVDQELMLPEKYGLQLYPLWLVLQIDLHHADYERYNNDAILYNEMESAMLRDYSREGRWRPSRPEDWPEWKPVRPVSGLRF